MQVGSNVRLIAFGRDDQASITFRLTGLIHDDSEAWLLKPLHANLQCDCIGWIVFDWHNLWLIAFRFETKPPLATGVIKGDFELPFGPLRSGMLIECPIASSNEFELRDVITGFCIYNRSVRNQFRTHNHLLNVFARQIRFTGNTTPSRLTAVVLNGICWSIGPDPYSRFIGPGILDIKVLPDKLQTAMFAPRIRRNENAGNGVSVRINGLNPDCFCGLQLYCNFNGLVGDCYVLQFRSKALFPCGDRIGATFTMWKTECPHRVCDGNIRMSVRQISTHTEHDARDRIPISISDFAGEQSSRFQYRRILTFEQSGP